MDEVKVVVPEGTEADDTATSQKAGAENQEQAQEQTQEKMLSISQDELDDIITRRLERQEEKLKKDFQAQREEEIRKSKLTQAEKEQEARKDLEDRLAQAEHENRMIKLENKTSEILTEAELPQSFKAFLMGEDEASTRENIKKFNEVYRAEIKRATEEKWKNNAPGTATREVTGEDAVWNNIIEKYR